MPSSSIESWAGVTLILPSFAAGQTNRPFSRRLLKRHAPCASHQMILSRSPRRPRNTNRWPEYGSSLSTFSAWAANVLNPRRISVTPAASHTRVLEGTGIKLPNPEPTQQRPSEMWGLQSGCAAHLTKRYPRALQTEYHRCMEQRHPRRVANQAWRPPLQ